MDAATIASICTLIAVVFTSVLQYVRESRARNWALQDKLALTTVTTEIKDKIVENTDISTKAFHEANTVNLKLEKLGLTHDADIKELIQKSDIRNGHVVELVDEVKASQANRNKAEDAKVIGTLREDVAALKAHPAPVVEAVKEVAGAIKKTKRK